jgi:O-antigen/teichoic acid export membrane protein
MVSQVFTRICYANQDTGSVLMIETVGIVVRFGMLFPLVSEYGIVGAAAAVPLGFGVQLFTAIVLSRRSMLGKSRGRLGGSGVLEAGIRSE